MNLSDTFYVALCMTVLILGVVYWFWTQNQYIQRKLNLLENIVFELKTQLSNLASSGGSSHFMPMDPGPLGPVVQGMPTGLSPAVYAPAPTDEDDLLHEELHGEVEAEDLGSNENVASPTSSAKEGDVVAQAAADESDHLQPGGVGSGVTEQLVPDNVSKGSTLDGMTLKELRRLGEQRGIAKAATMSKQKLIDAVRALPNVITPYEAGDSTLDLS